MGRVYVQFKEMEQTTVAMAFGSPQDPDVWPALEEIDTDDPRFYDFLKKMSMLPNTWAYEESSAS